MKLVKPNYIVDRIYVNDNGVFPNSSLSVLLYPDVLKLPKLFPAFAVARLFTSNSWTYSWKGGVYAYHHYHSNAHKVLGIYEGSGTVLFGGEGGQEVQIQKGDVLIIPAGVAHKNVSGQNSFKCVAAYPKGKKYDLMLGKEGERPQADKNISEVVVPSKDPVFGTLRGVFRLW